MKKQRFVERTTQYSVEDIMLNLVLVAIHKYKASFQPDCKESPHRAKMSVIKSIGQFCRIAKRYDNADGAFNMQEIRSDVNAYHFDDAKYNVMQMRHALASPIT